MILSLTKRTDYQTFDRASSEQKSNRNIADPPPQGQEKSIAPASPVAEAKTGGRSRLPRITPGNRRAAHP
jgi:hypothetical protein